MNHELTAKWHELDKVRVGLKDVVVLRPDLRVADGYIQYSTDSGMTWTNLIAVADLKGADGAKGDTGATGPAGPVGPQGPAGAPGKDGANGETGPAGPHGLKGADGITPHIGDDGHWYLGAEDTGKPSRGEKGDKGDPGEKGDTGEQGPKGDTGEQGPAGAGVPDGGTSGQLLSKTESGTEWIDPPQSGAQSDWNQNDETAPDYVKNRPFYTGDPVETVLVEESTVSFTGNPSGVYAGTVQSTFSATPGEIYKVSWDGTTYEIACASIEGRIFIGNPSILGGGPDTGEPFLVMTGVIGPGSLGIIVYTSDTSASHTFSIIGNQTQIVKIPAKYIDKDASGYIVVHRNATMTEQEAENYRSAISEGEDVFVIWQSLYLSDINLSTITDSTGVSVRYLYLNTLNGENYSIEKNSEGLFELNDRVLSRAYFPFYEGIGEKTPIIELKNKQFNISSGTILDGVGTTDILFSVNTNGTKSKDFNVLGNGEAVTPALILYSSTADSTKKFRITVDDSGTLKATEVT